MSINFDETNEMHVEAAKLATCAQVEYWLEITESITIIGGVKSFNLQNVSINFTDGGISMVCGRARGYLNNQGLMYRGI